MSNDFLLAKFWSPSAVDNAMVRAAKAQITLESINEGKIEETIDSLNLEIDASIVELQTGIEYISSKEKENVCRVLLRISKYRENNIPASRSTSENAELIKSLNNIDKFLKSIRGNGCN